MSKWIQELSKEEDGSVAAEYGLLIAGIAVVMGAAALALGGRIRDLFNSINF
jgi:pilus assembly protein Flp/PilA